MKSIIFITALAMLFLHCFSVSKKDGKSGFLYQDPDDEEADSFFETNSESSNDQDTLESSKKQVGYAAWYGRELHGKPTASGEIFNMNKYTASHRDFPIGSMIMVRNLKNNKKKILKVNDRGPYVEGRIVDVSYVAARDLGFAEEGIAKVEVRLVKKAEFSFLNKLEAGGTGFSELRTASKGNSDEKDFFFADGIKPKGYTVQVGAFKIRGNAEYYRDEMEERFNRRVFIATQGIWHYVWIGDFENSNKARSFMEKLKSEEIDVMYRGKT